MLAARIRKRRKKHLIGWWELNVERNFQVCQSFCVFCAFLRQKFGLHSGGSLSRD
jgi:hypothetical protein